MEKEKAAEGGEGLLQRPKSQILQYAWQNAPNEGVRPPGYCRIVVAGVGGAGNNTVTRLTEMGIKGAETIAINTDILHLNASRAMHKILIGEKTTRGLGAGGDPALGRAAIEESKSKIEELEPHR